MHRGTGFQLGAAVWTGVKLVDAVALVLRRTVAAHAEENDAPPAGPPPSPSSRVAFGAGSVSRNAAALE